MADDPIVIKDADKARVPVLLDTVTERNGVAVETGDRVQIVRLAHGIDGQATDVKPDSPLPIGDNSPPLRQIGIGGELLLAGELTEILIENPGRALLEVMLDAPDGAVPVPRMWISCGGTDAQLSKGNFLRPGGQFQQWTADRVTVIADESCTVTWVEWGT